AHLRLETRREGQCPASGGFRQAEQGGTAHRQDAAFCDDADVLAAMPAEERADHALGLAPAIGAGRIEMTDAGRMGTFERFMTGTSRDASHDGRGAEAYGGNVDW